MNVTKLIAAAKVYQTNRNNQKDVPWDKAKDAESIFDEMVSFGLAGIHEIAGSFFGTCEDGALFVASIENKSILIGKYKDFAEFTDSILAGDE